MDERQFQVETKFELFRRFNCSNIHEGESEEAVNFCE
jgi:hypothetical protein